MISMAGFSYSFHNFEKNKHVRASLREVQISHKHAREVALAVKGMYLSKAREFLENVVKLKQPVAYRRYKQQVGHKSNLQGFPAGRFPVKTSKEFLRLLENLEANAEYKGMDLDRLKLIHVSAYPGVKIERFTPRAFGSNTAKNNTLVHVEIVGMEK